MVRSRVTRWIRRSQLFTLAALMSASTLVVMAPTDSSAVAVNAAEVFNSNVAATNSVVSGSTTGVTGYTYVVSCAANTNSTVSISGSYAADGSYTQSGSVSIRTSWFYVTSARNGASYSWTCTSSANATVGLTVYRFTNLLSNTPLTTTNAASNGTPSSGTLNTINPTSYLYAFGASSGNNQPSAWTNNFSLLGAGGQAGKPGTRIGYGLGGLNTTTTGAYSTGYTASITDPWRIQFLAFQVRPAIFETSIVNASGTPISSPSYAMTSIPSSFSCQTSTGTFGTSASRIRVTSDDTAAWSLSIAATNGSGATWSNGSGGTYAFNNATNAGCATGQLSLGFTSMTYATTCTTGSANTTLASGTQSFASGSVNAITLMSTNSSAETGCYRDLYNIDLSQTIPAEKTPGTYSLGLTVTLTAS